LANELRQDGLGRPLSLEKPARRRSSLRLDRPWRLLTLPYLLFLIIPLVSLLFFTTPARLWATVQQAQVQQAITLSLVTSLSTVVLTLLFGTPVAFYLSHRHYRLFRLLDTIVDLPTVLPPAVAGVALLIAFGRTGLLGGTLNSLGITIPFTQVAVIMAQSFVAAPFYIKSAALGFTAVDCEIRKAAALDGANRWQTFRYIIVPISWMAIVSGAAMTWARALGEFGATIIFAGNFPGRTQTMPLAIYIGFQIDLNIALTLSVILVGFSFLILLLLKALLYQKVELNPEEAFD
jgi:molybdate transport system permease protein